MADALKLVLLIRLPWWWRLYLLGCASFARFYNASPDCEKIVMRILRNTSYKVVRNG